MSSRLANEKKDLSFGFGLFAGDPALSAHLDGLAFREMDRKLREVLSGILSEKGRPLAVDEYRKLTGKKRLTISVVDGYLAPSKVERRIPLIDALALAYAGGEKRGLQKLSGEIAKLAGLHVISDADFNLLKEKKIELQIEEAHAKRKELRKQRKSIIGG